MPQWWKWYSCALRCAPAHRTHAPRCFHAARPCQQRTRPRQLPPSRARWLGFFPLRSALRAQRRVFPLLNLIMRRLFFAFLPISCADTDFIRYAWGALMVNQFSEVDPIWQGGLTVLESYRLKARVCGRWGRGRGLLYACCAAVASAGARGALHRGREAAVRGSECDPLAPKAGRMMSD